MREIHREVCRGLVWKRRESFSFGDSRAMTKVQDMSERKILICSATEALAGSKV